MFTRAFKTKWKFIIWFSNFSYTCLVKKFDVILHKEINRNNTLMFALSRAFAKIVFLDTTTSRQLTFALRQNIFTYLETFGPGKCFSGRLRMFSHTSKEMYPAPRVDNTAITTQHRFIIITMDCNVMDDKRTTLYTEVILNAFLFRVNGRKYI